MDLDEEATNILVSLRSRDPCRKFANSPQRRAVRYTFRFPCKQARTWKQQIIHAPWADDRSSSTCQAAFTRQAGKEHAKTERGVTFASATEKCLLLHPPTFSPHTNLATYVHASSRDRRVSQQITKGRRSGGDRWILSRSIYARGVRCRFRSYARAGREKKKEKKMKRREKRRKRKLRRGRGRNGRNEKERERKKKKRTICRANRCNENRGSPVVVSTNRAKRRGGKIEEIESRERNETKRRRRRKRDKDLEISAGFSRRFLAPCFDEPIDCRWKIEATTRESDPPRLVTKSATWY